MVNVTEDEPNVFLIKSMELIKIPIIPINSTRGLESR